jgi:L-glyceraldehyde 3-phosphate reductase
MSYQAAPNRYENATFRKTGRSGLVLPALSLGLWHNFGDTATIDRQRAILRQAFDLGITHFDLANNYGPPPGSAEINFGRILKEDFAAHRDELIISTKAGWVMWDGPYGKGGGSRKAILSSLDQSLGRMGVNYVDIFYSHRFDADTPLEETAGALASAVHQGKALYVGISSYSAGKTREIAKILADLKVPLLIHQPAYNMFNRWIENGLLDATEEAGAGVIAFTPLAQGLLTNKYLNGVPADARINNAGGGSLKEDHLSADNITRVKALNEIAKKRGQSLAQMALAWVLRDPRVTSALIGASRPEQLVENVEALKNISFSDQELAEIDSYALEGGVNLWEKPSTDQKV